jgi:hypothetical protein
LSTEETSGRGWQPLLSGTAAEAAREAVFAIAADLSRPQAAAAIESPLASGPSGKALFFSYVHQTFPDRGWDDVCLLYLEQSLAAVGSSHLGPSLFSGFSGAGWVLRHLQGRTFESSEEDPGAEVEEVLLQALSRSPSGWPAELILGLAGLGVYFLERLPGEPARRGVELVVEHLAGSAERVDDGLTWFTPPEGVPPSHQEKAPAGCYNLGVSHGVAGAIGFLAAACRRSAEVEEVRRLIDGAASWLLAQRLPDGAGAWFPSIVGPGIDPEPSLLSWCYGDAGIASVLLAAARSLGRRDLEEEALACARQAAGRRGDGTRAIDTGLCHGAAGLGHLFNRLFQSTGDPAFREAALHWLERALAMRRPGSGVGGFQSAAFTESGEVIWRDDSSFLTGAAGIGLALLAAITPVEPEWDRVLLLSS